MIRRIGLGLVLILQIFSLTVSCSWNQDQKEPSTYLIPDSIRGEVIIIHNFKKGEKSEMAGNKRIYRIPENGILYSQELLTYGLSNDDYYHVDKNGKRKTLLIEVNTNNKNELCVYNITTGVISIEDVQYPYEAFMVCQKDSIEHYNNFTLNLNK